ncbi:hypothetical protein ACQBAR_06220 [Propionibacteriaceae bacterium Y1685]|uniref:hypothetical protein n=1 Tax=Microlunatus sp. Y1700 TaxID=3418487 RepID=UPI003B80BCA8
MFHVVDIAAASRRQNTSALPDAPVVIEADDRMNARIAAQTARALRAAAAQELRLANRLDPGCQLA